MKKYNLIYIFFLLIISCKIISSKGSVFNEASYKNDFLTMKGISIDTIKNDKKNVIDLLFDKNNGNEIRVLDSLNINSENYLLSRFYRVKTTEKVYSFAFFQDLDYSINDTYFLIIKSQSDGHFYFLNDCLSYDLYRFGDYNNDGNLEYAEIDSENKMLLFFSLQDGVKIEQKDLNLKLRIVPKKNLNETLYVIRPR